MKNLKQVWVSLLILLAGPSNACTESQNPEDVVQAQIEAYNAHDVERFASCYSDTVKIYQLGESAPMLSGLSQLTESYQFLNQVPKEYKAIIDKRIVNGPFVIDNERVVGRGPDLEDVSVVAIYEVRDGKILNVWFPSSR